MGVSAATRRLVPSIGSSPLRVALGSSGNTNVVRSNSSANACIWKGKPPPVAKPLGELELGQQVLYDMTTRFKFSLLAFPDANPRPPVLSRPLVQSLTYCNLLPL